MTWLIIAGNVAVWALVIIATLIWFKYMDAFHDRAFAEQEVRLNHGGRSRGSRSAGTSGAHGALRRVY